MYFGKIVEYGDVQQIFEAPQADYTRQLLSAIPVSHPRLRKRKPVPA
jgi:ABC-type oligopeptide transport system ATPase subunit